MLSPDAQVTSAAAEQPPWGTHAPSRAAAAVLELSRRTWLGRGGARRLLSAAFKRLHTGPVDVSLWGSRVRLHPDRNVSERKALLRPDHYDGPERAALRQAMARPSAVFVDVGANAGLYSLDAALHAAANARILSIDPDPTLLARFAFNLAEARQLGLVPDTLVALPVSVAISDSEGMAQFATGGDEGSRGLVELLAAPAPSRQVRVRPLLAVLNEARIKRIDAMKIDVEGHEDRVLPPFLVTAPASLWPHLIIIEHLQRSSWRIDCIADVQACGYRINLTTRNNTVLERLAAA